jgi:hypothetical protein
VRAAVNYRECELATALQFLVDTVCKWSINPITNPATVYNHSYTSHHMPCLLLTATAVRTGRYKHSPVSRHNGHQGIGGAVPLMLILQLPWVLLPSLSLISTRTAISGFPKRACRPIMVENTDIFASKNPFNFRYLWSRTANHEMQFRVRHELYGSELHNCILKCRWMEITLMTVDS